MLQRNKSTQLRRRAARNCKWKVISPLFVALARAVNYREQTRNLQSDQRKSFILFCHETFRHFFLFFRREITTEASLALRLIWPPYDNGRTYLAESAVTAAASQLEKWRSNLSLTQFFGVRILGRPKSKLSCKRSIDKFQTHFFTPENPFIKSHYSIATCQQID